MRAQPELPRLVARGTPPSQVPGRGTASTRTGCARPGRRNRLPGRRGEVRALHRHRDARAQDAEENVFRYRVCFYLLDLDELPELDRRVRLFRWNRRGVVSLYDRDHMDVRAYPERARDQADRILLVTNLRVLGYVFNPLAASSTATRAASSPASSPR